MKADSFQLFERIKWNNNEKLLEYEQKRKGIVIEKVIENFLSKKWK